MDNGTATALTCTITNPARTCTDTTHSVTFATGDQFSVRYVFSNATNPSSGGGFTVKDN